MGIRNACFSCLRFFRFGGFRWAHLFSLTPYEIFFSEPFGITRKLFAREGLGIQRQSENIKAIIRFFFKRVLLVKIGMDTIGTRDCCRSFFCIRSEIGILECSLFRKVFVISSSHEQNSDPVFFWMRTLFIPKMPSYSSA